MYTSEEYEAMARWAAELFDHITKECPQTREGALQQVFLQSQRYEFLFWEMAFHREKWQA
jgi:thiaminase/transcriptional activator TenA